MCALGRDSTSVLKFALKRAFLYFSFLITHILKLLNNLLGRYATVVDHLAVRDVAQGAPLGGGSTLHPGLNKNKIGHLKIKNYKLERVENFKYLGVTLNEDNNNQIDL